MRVFAKKILGEFWEKHPDCEQQLKAWFQEASQAEWQNNNVLKSKYPLASLLADYKIVFNIKGNHYRLIMKMNYDYQMIRIRFIGTFAAYDKIDANKI